MSSGKRITVISAGIVALGLCALALVKAMAPESAHRAIAFGCFAFCSLGFFAIACVYFFTPRFLSYHQQASGMQWEDLTPQFRGLILAVLRIVAGGFFCAAMAAAVLLWVPFRQGLSWSGPAIFVIYNAMALPALYGTILVKKNTPAIPPVIPLVTAITLTVMGLVLSL